MEYAFPSIAVTAAVSFGNKFFHTIPNLSVGRLTGEPARPNSVSVVRKYDCLWEFVSGGDSIL
jgi:hypothetical protein